MRNKIQLYIEGIRADLDNGSFLLFNYTQEDLSNPTVIKNSFSKQITLKGTPRNDEIFGHLYRNDRNTLYGSPYNGPYFDPCRKTSFVLYNEANEIVESGYLKLDEIVTARKRHSYKVTLYGGLGSFLYGLSYRPDGEKMTLADLDFGETLDFTINRQAVADAWARMDGDTTKPAKWDILNFAPAYMGLPPSPFDANKCVISPASLGMTYKDEGFDLLSTGGFTVATLNEKVTGNEAGDFRSYLQKPVIKLSAVINAICDPSNNGGYTVNLDTDFFDPPLNEYWDRSWLTLPVLNDLNINATETSTTQTLLGLDTKTAIVGGGSGNVAITVQAQPYAIMTGLPNLNYRLWCWNPVEQIVNYLVLTVTLYDSSDNVISEATYRIGSEISRLRPSIPPPDFTFDHIDGTGRFVDSNGTPVVFPLFAQAENASAFKVSMTAEEYWDGNGTWPGDHTWEMWEVGETVVANGYLFDPSMGSVSVDVTATNTSNVRTGATITQAALLSGSKTPAEYLLSLCKMFGLQLLAHKDSKTIDVISRSNFYDGGTVDLNARIDRGRDIVKKPFAFSAKWYLFGNGQEGEYAEYYLANHGRPFGQYRVNTGYDFDAEQKLMTESIIFRNFPSLMEASPFFCDLVRNGKDVPAVLMAGGKYSLYDGSETKTVELPNLFDAAKTWVNASYPMHDDWEKPQFHGPEDAHVDERDTLLLFNAMEDVSGRMLSLTDDSASMLTLNNNTPCWFPFLCKVDPTAHITAMPHFSRYTWSGSTINYQLDWGDPLEVQIPGATISSGSNIFDQYWAKYIGDRYDDDSAVVTAYVDLRGFQVNEDLFRQFYAFDGAIWALNKIIDHSLTTDGPTKCEFVKVQDKTNYTTN